MNYNDALEDSLQKLRAGGQLDRVVAAHPQHAARLREDLTTAQQVREASATLPDLSVRAAWRLQSALEAEAAERQAATRRTHTPRAGAWGVSPVLHYRRGAAHRRRCVRCAAVKWLGRASSAGGRR